MIQAGEFSDWLRKTKQVEHGGYGAEVECGECVGCCTSSYFIHVDPDEWDCLAAIPEQFLFPAPGLPKGTLLMGFDQRGHCPMLSDGHCLIYAQRPRTCRDFDCRVLAAAKLLAGGPERNAINQRVQQWKFHYRDAETLRVQSAIQRAAGFLSEHCRLFPADYLPSNPSQLARLAIAVYKEFMTPCDRDPASVAQRVRAVLSTAKNNTQRTHS